MLLMAHGAAAARAQMSPTVSTHKLLMVLMLIFRYVVGPRPRLQGPAWTEGSSLRLDDDGASSCASPSSSLRHVIYDLTLTACPRQKTVYETIAAGGIGRQLTAATSLERSDQCLYCSVDSPCQHHISPYSAEESFKLSWSWRQYSDIITSLEYLHENRECLDSASDDARCRAVRHATASPWEACRCRLLEEPTEAPGPALLDLVNSTASQPNSSDGEGNPMWWQLLTTQTGSNDGKGVSSAPEQPLLSIQPDSNSSEGVLTAPEQPLLTDREVVLTEPEQPLPHSDHYDERSVPWHLSPGFKFVPTDQELVLHYLKNKILELNPPVLQPVSERENVYYIDADAITLDVSNGHKELLGFFFVHKQAYPNGCFYTTPNGFWMVRGLPSEVKHDGRVIAFKTSMDYYHGKPSYGCITPWSMFEYKLNTSLLDLRNFKHPSIPIYPPGRVGFLTWQSDLLVKHMNSYVVCKVRKTERRTMDMMEMEKDVSYLRRRQSLKKIKIRAPKPKAAFPRRISGVPKIPRRRKC